MKWSPLTVVFRCNQSGVVFHHLQESTAWRNDTGFEHVLYDASIFVLDSHGVKELLESNISVILTHDVPFLQLGALGSFHLHF